MELYLPNKLLEFQFNSANVFTAEQNTVQYTLLLLLLLLLLLSLLLLLLFMKLGVVMKHLLLKLCKDQEPCK